MKSAPDVTADEKPESALPDGLDHGPEDDIDPRIARSRARILDAATDLLVEAGPRAVTVDAVSERSKVAKSTMYRHFDSTSSLLLEVIRCNVPQLEPPKPEDGFEKSLKTMAGTVARTLQKPKWAGILPAFLTLEKQFPEIAELKRQDSAIREDHLAAILAQGVAEKTVPKSLNVQQVVLMIVGPLMLACLQHEEIDLQTLADELVDRLIASYRI